PTMSLPDPSTTQNEGYVSATCFDLLLIELVPMAYRIAADLAAKEEVWLASKRRTNLGVGGIGGTAPGLDEEELRETVFFRLDSIGYRVGLALAERFSRERPRFTDPLDVIKFLCKDLWVVVFRKQIDNLKTNHRGVYVLTDNNFKPLKNMSLEKAGAGRSRETMMQQAQPFLYFPAGVIRGVLSALGIQASVVAETSELPGATFQIRTVGSKP
ncbi:transport protein particle component, partial [Rhizodiscina lignyota]